MAAGSNKTYPFFDNLRAVAATVSDSIREIERKMQNSKYELPENNALIKLTHLCDEVNTYKNDSLFILQQLCEESQRYVRYRQDIEVLVDGMEKSIDRVEELLTGYGYKKWHPECTFADDCSQFSSNTENGTPLKEMPPDVRLAVEEEQQSALEKTPLLADYGLTAKIPKYLPSALKDKQSAVKSTKKQVHFESPERETDFKGKENRVPCSFQKTPLLEDYGLPSRKRDLPVSHTKGPLRIKKQLNFQSPLGSVSSNVIYSSDSLPHSEVDNSDDFEELVNLLNSGVEELNVAVPKLQSDMKSSTPEEHLLSYNHRLKFASKIQGNNDRTPEDPIEPSLTHLYKDAEPSTPKTPEFEVPSSLENWLQSQKKK